MQMEAAVNKSIRRKLYSNMCAFWFIINGYPTLLALGTGLGDAQITQIPHYIEKSIIWFLIVMITAKITSSCLRA